jgi:cytochrome c heme-lyase
VGSGIKQDGAQLCAQVLLLLQAHKVVLILPQGWQPSEADMPTVVAIHNTVNERAWAEVLAWESLHCGPGRACPAPKLKRFMGKPNEYSPKARLLNFLVRDLRRLPFWDGAWMRLKDGVCVVLCNN